MVVMSWSKLVIYGYTNCMSSCPLLQFGHIHVMYQELCFLLSQCSQFDLLHVPHVFLIWFTFLWLVGHAKARRNF
jgi:hypothetical protein